MQKLRIPLSASTFGTDEIEEAVNVLRSGAVTMGRLCAQFEAEFARSQGVKHAVFVNSGSSANLLAFFALANAQWPLSRGRKPLQAGDEVIVPAVTWSTTVWPIVQAGLTPVLVDCDPLTLQIDVNQLDQAWSPKTRAICPVHILGNAVDLGTLQSFARERNLWIVEDTCESLGTRYRDVPVGTFGDLGTYSFYFSHHITTIEGGMVVTHDDDTAELLRVMRAHGWTRHLRESGKVEDQYPEIDPRFLFINTGFNLRPTEINGAFGIHQLRKLDGFNRRRREIAAQWIEAFSAPEIERRIRPMQVTPGTECTWFGFPVLCDSTATRDKLRSHLEAAQIETRPIVAGNLVRQPAFRHLRHRVVGTLRGADQVMERGLYWGSHPGMVQTEIGYVVEHVHQALVRT